MTTGAPAGRTLRVPALLGLSLVAALGCQDLREYAGDWSGEISSDPALAHGFEPGTSLSVGITEVGRDHVAFVATWNGRSAPFVPIRRAAGDSLSEMQLPGEPLRTFLGFVEPPGESPYLTVMSLYPENRIELRLIRGADEAYGVFSLRRTRVR
jgi:hypothetical protein